MQEQMKKGSLGLLLLHLLRERPSYGYELCERVRARSGGTLRFEDGAVYPLLHAFERQGLLEGYWEREQSAGVSAGEQVDTMQAVEVTGSAEAMTSVAAVTADGARRGPRRRYYQLTPSGHEALQAALGEWRAFTSGVERVLGEPGLTPGNPAIG